MEYPAQTRDEIKKYVVGAPARVGLLAPVDVSVPAGNTGLDPSQTNFFQVCLSLLKACLTGLHKGIPSHILHPAMMICS